MNRSLLLVICDFLLLSLLALARFDEPADQAPEAEQAIEQDAQANQDLIDVLKMSLDAEQENRADLSTELKETQEELEARAKALAEREAKLEESQQNAEQLAAEKARLEEQRATLALANEAAEAERARLAEQSEAARQKLAEAERDRIELAKSLAEVKETAATSTERLRAIQSELEAKAAAVEKLDEERQRLASEVKTAELEKQTLSTQLEVSRTEARTAAERLEVAQRDIEITRREKASMQQTTQTLAEGVGALAESTDQIREEVKRAQPLSLNTIFDRYQKNKVRITFDAKESGVFGSSTEQYSLDTVLVRDGASVYALIPASKTPFRKSGLLGVTGIIRFGSRAGRFDSVGSLSADPRILALRLSESFPANWGVTAFNLAKEPLKYPQAILVNDQGKYGEVGFKIVPAHPEYLDMDSSIFNELFGEFSPREGDLVFSQTGDLIGMMVNGQFAVIAPSANLSAKLSLGDSFSAALVKAYQQRVQANAQLLPPDLR
ncbi:hypothetical protein [Cerasicoccus arenae]|uniref:Chromosome partition protein Smc n=1 Tax=Cerasicoccus arenae TaxID=424488 RepID=A0A8J3DJR2_9BACT|nr:hypothetical protein [Cerasicoccus arenae]MBK1857364.1 hypothetical protein [Cerasicoccus arenae]GHC09021.1 hypothetical protein GCM10007047_27850 [Cerasicoccus arenae]